MACGGSSSSSGLGSATVHSLPAPLPKSPPADLYGRRQEMAKLDLLERERCYLEEELKFVEGLQPASRCCKEIVDFVSANPDPIIPTKNRKSCSLWKWLCGSSCFNLSWIFCCTGCSAQIKVPKCRCCSLEDCCSCTNCSIPECSCWCNPCYCCCTKNPCRGCCCSLKSISCSNCCCKFNCSCPKCPSCSDLCGCFGGLRNCCCCNDCCFCCC